MAHEYSRHFNERLGGALTFRRVFPLTLLLMVFVLAVRQSALLDPDLWWHLRAGEDIISTWSIPHIDDYSFTKRGSEWVTHEWLSEVLLYGTFRLTGFVGLVFIFSSLIIVALWITYRRSSGRPYVAGLALLLAAASSSPLFGIRPQMFTFLLASIYLTLLSRFAHDGHNRPLWWLIPMMLLWVNLHAGFALGLALIGLYGISMVLDGFWKRARHLGILLIACAAVVPLNPNGFRMFSYPYETLTSHAMAAYIEEWASPDFHKVMYLPLAALLFATLGILVMSPKRARAGELFLLLVTGFGSLRSVRHIPIFALVAAPVFADHLWSLMKTRGWDKWFTAPDTPAVGGKLIIGAVLVIAPVILGVSRLWHFMSHRQTYEAIRNPVAAVSFIQAQHLPGPLYNRYGWGGYLIYRLYPEYRVYIDGRADVYGDDFFIEAMNTYDGLKGWREPLDRHGIRTVLIAPDIALASLLRSDGEWETVYEDYQAIIFTRVNAGLTRKFNPISAGEISAQLHSYSTYISGFAQEQASRWPLSFVILVDDRSYDLSNLDRWYERDAGERIGGSVIYGVRMRAEGFTRSR